MDVQIDDWTIKEKLVLACCVTRNGDQNWVSVCRTMKVIAESSGDATRPLEWYSQKNIAKKYNELLNTSSLSKRKSRGGTSEAINVETPTEQVLRKLTFARIEELDKFIKTERERYNKLKRDMVKVQSGKLDGQLSSILSEIQRGQPIESVIEDDNEHIEEVSQPSTTTTAASSISTSRPQRAPKETEKFKKYIEQRQKHNAKYQHHHTPSSTVETAPTETTILTNISSMKPVDVIPVGPSPAQVQNMSRLSETTSLQKSEMASQPRGLLIAKPDHKLPATSPTTPTLKKEQGSFLTSLLASPATEIKAKVNKLTDELKEPLKKIHHVAKENYQAYKQARTPAHIGTNSLETAPVLSKLLEASITSPPKVTSEIMKPKVKDEFPKAITSSCPKNDNPKTTSPKSPKDEEEKKSVNQCESSKEPASEVKIDKKTEQSALAENEKIVEVEVKVKAECVVPKESETKVTEDDDKEILFKNQTKSVSPLMIEVSKTHSTPTKDEPHVEVAEPPVKKRLLNKQFLGDVADNLDLDASLKLKKKSKGRVNRPGRKKVLKIDLQKDVDSEISEFDSSLESKDLDLLDEKKVRTPGTPCCSSPASPALSVGSNCDPEVAQLQRAWRKSIMLVWKAAASHKYANVFLHPVTDEEAPGYSSIVYKPMDLSSIKKSIETGVIQTTTEFQRDIMLMFQNALMYNRKEHDVYRMAQEMRNDVLEQIQSFISTQLIMQTSDREVKTLRVKGEAPGHTRHSSSKSGFPFLSL